MKIEWALNIDGGTQEVDLFRDGERLGSHPPSVSSYMDGGLIPNTRYTYEALVAQAGLTAAATAATLAYPPQGGHTRSVHWTGFEFYIVDERNPAGTEYRVILRGNGVDVSDWSTDKCLAYDGLVRTERLPALLLHHHREKSGRGRNATCQPPRRGEAGQGPRSGRHPRLHESNNDPWVAARIDDLQAIYGLTDAAVDWLYQRHPHRAAARNTGKGKRTWGRDMRDSSREGRVGIGHSEP